MSKTVGVPKEIFANEGRVAATPATVEKLRELGFEVWVQIGAGEAAGYDDDAYTAAGAELCGDPRKLWAAADVVLKVRPPHDHPELGCHEADLLREDAVLISFIWPAQNGPLLERLKQRRASVLAMDAVPRLTRAQKLDALSSMALVAGYRAVVVAAHHFDSFFAGQMTAAGKVTPARVLVIGAGVAGLAAIAAARGLGAIVLAFDTRAEVKDQVRSLGAEFIEVALSESGEGGGGYARSMSEAFIAAEMALFRQHAPEVDVVITTALVPGRPAPKLWLADMVESMRTGSVIVDLAAEQGGNCELTRPGHVVVEHGVTIVGFTDYTRPMAHTASQLYGTNLVHLLEELGGAQDFAIDLDDEVIRGALVVHRGEITWRPPSAAPRPPAPAAAPVQRQAAPAPPPAAPIPAAAAPKAGLLAPGSVLLGIGALALALAWGWIKLGSGGAAPSPAAAELVRHGTVFVLACFVGWQLIWSVSPALHTPLMSVTNAISGIIALGGLLQSMREGGGAAALLGAAAVLLAMINVSGGFWVTQRMLRMFRRA